MFVLLKFLIRRIYYCCLILEWNFLYVMNLKLDVIIILISSLFNNVFSIGFMLVFDDLIIIIGNIYICNFIYGCFMCFF